MVSLCFKKCRKRPLAEPGNIIGERYRLVRQLGEGGMGTVFEALDERFGGRVALKLIHPELAESSESIQRFRREAEAAATAGHKAIVGVFDFGLTDDGSQYLVMEFLDGLSLNEKLNQAGNLDVSMLQCGKLEPDGGFQVVLD